jgi:microcin C transport system substrate-binding protein
MFRIWIFAALTLGLVGINPQLLGAELPKDLKWETNDSDPVWADPSAKKGGTFRSSITSFPLTFRVVGPDSNGGFRSEILENMWGLVGIHPNTGSYYPWIATHWAFSDDNKTVYYKLNKKAKWSDGKPITGKDFAFTLEFMRSKNIVAPWYNEYYTEQFERVDIFDDHTIAIVKKVAKPRDDMLYYADIRPIPSHFYGGKVDKDFIKKYNWKVEPVAGPYVINEKSIKKGKSIEFMRVKDWWGADLKYNVGRFNVDKVRYKVLRDTNVTWEHFLKGNLDQHGITLPDYWHDKAKGKDFDKGYIKKLWFYVDQPQAPLGFYLNEANPILKDINVRLALQHSTAVQKVIKQILRNDYFQLTHGTVGYGEYSKNDIKAREFDLKKADEYLVKAGFKKRGPDGIRVKGKQRLSFNVTYTAQHHTPRLVVFKEEMKKAGIEINLKQMDGATGFKSMMEKKHDIAWMAWSATVKPQFWGSWHSENANKPQTTNITNTAIPALDKAIDGYRNSMETKDRIKFSHEAQQIIHDNASFIPTFEVPYHREAYWAQWQLPRGGGGGVVYGVFGSRVFVLLV